MNKRSSLPLRSSHCNGNHPQRDCSSGSFDSSTQSFPRNTLRSLRNLKLLRNQSRSIRGTSESDSCSLDVEIVNENRRPTLDSLPKLVEISNQNSDNEDQKERQSPATLSVCATREAPQNSNSIEIRICRSSVVSDEPPSLQQLQLNASLANDSNSLENRDKRPPLKRMANSSRSSSPTESGNDLGAIEYYPGVQALGRQLSSASNRKSSYGSQRVPQSMNRAAMYRHMHSAYEPGDPKGQRLNLMGQPVHLKHKRLNSSFQILQSKVYNFLERPKGKFAISYHSLMFLLVFLCLLLSVMSTVEQYSSISLSILLRLEIFLVIGYTMEYTLRIWSAGCRSRYQDIGGRLRFMKQPFNLLDLIICVLSFFLLTMRQGKGNTFAPYALRGLKFLQILRIVRMDRRAGTWKLLGSVVYLHRQELITTFYIGFLGLIFASFVVYQTEKETNEQFATYADALWWGIVTLTTVGYGDATPKTWPGKLTASFFAIMGISFFALPAGILGSGFALKVQQQQRQKHVARRRQPAASLIQCLWRCYAANEDSLSVATWLIHVKAKSVKTNNNAHENSHRSSFRKGPSLLTRIQSTRSKKHNPNSDWNSGDPPTAPGVRSMPSGGGQMLSRHGSIRRNQCRTGRPSVDSFRNQFTGSHSNLKESLKISDSKRSSRQGSIFSLQFDSLPNPFSSIPNSRRNSAESEQDEETQMLTKLRPCHKVAIRFVRKMKYFVYRRKFREALKPYDVKDVIEQYAAGHVELLSRVKEIQQRIDLVVGSKDKKKQAETKMTVASRIVKLESQITYLERKLDHLINVYRKDQQRYRRTDTATSAYEEEEVNNNPPANNPTTAIPSCPVKDSLLLAPFYKREANNKSTMSMNLLSPEAGRPNRSRDNRLKMRSSSQPTSLENLRILTDNATDNGSETSRQNTEDSNGSDKKASLFLPLRSTSIKIPAFFDRNNRNKIQ